MIRAGREAPKGAVLLGRAGHVGEAYAEDIDECRAAVDQSGLDYFAHFSTGIVDFELGFPDSWQNRQDRTSAYMRAGRQLGLAVALLESACEPLDSGPLTRVVLQGERGALFHVVKVAGQNFFGLTLDGSTRNVDKTDGQLADLVASAAQRIGASSLGWGGFLTREQSGVLWQPYRVQLSQRDNAVAHVADYRPATGTGAVSSEVARACLDALHSYDLHYVGIFRQAQPAWRADIFDDDALSPLFKRVTPWSRRRGYERLIRQVSLQNRRFRQLLTLVNSDSVNRLVLDVARGAIYLLPLADNSALTLVGITLIKSQEESTDQKMRRLRDRVNSIMRQQALHSA
jgi:hypothetical protein